MSKKGTIIISLEGFKTFETGIQLRQVGDKFEKRTYYKNEEDEIVMIDCHDANDLVLKAKECKQAVEIIFTNEGEN